jgi:hypothetical protein
MITHGRHSDSKPQQWLTRLGITLNALQALTLLTLPTRDA